jgi:hypothetical protein
MGARFLTLPRRPGLLGWARLAAAFAVVVPTAITAVVCLGPRVVFGAENRRTVPIIVRQMLHYPPIDNEITRAEADRAMTEHDHAAWLRGEVGAWPEILLRYVHDCTAGTDRVLVTGQTPFQVGYLLERPIAGGHVFWHHRWRTDPDAEAGLLALIESQSIPFAISTHDPVLGDLEAYPRIHHHFETHYRDLPGSGGHLLVDARRRPASSFGPYGFPCFK